MEASIKPIKSLSIELHSKYKDRSRTGPQSFRAERPQIHSLQKGQDRGHPPIDGLRPIKRPSPFQDLPLQDLPSTRKQGETPEAIT